jgi:hypothetical protein
MKHQPTILAGNDQENMHSSSVPGKGAKHLTALSLPSLTTAGMLEASRACGGGGGEEDVVMDLLDLFGTGSNPGPEAIIAAIFVSSLPGVVVAFVAQYLAQRHEDQNTRRLYASARKLLADEVDNNRAALDAFWRTIESLDKDHQQDPKHHLAALAGNGLLGNVLPRWSFARWDQLAPETYAAFSEKEIGVIAQINRCLQSISDLYPALVTLTPEDKADLAKNMGGRFWTNDFADMRLSIYEKMASAVQQALSLPHPLAK